MSPLYTHCVHCQFPAVIPEVERALPRYCRQCRRVYVPCENPTAAPDRPVSTAAKKGRRRRLALRSLLQPRSKSTTPP